MKQFRFDTYQMLVKARDATFELMDSIMTTKNADSVAEFSLDYQNIKNMHLKRIFPTLLANGKLT